MGKKQKDDHKRARDIEKYIIRYTNEERRKHKLHKLVSDSNLSRIAYRHSRDMAMHHFFSHDNKKHQGPSDRAPDYTGVGENIMKIPLGDVILGKDKHVRHVSKKNPKKIAYYFVQGWMNSPGHRENVLRKEFRLIGVGVCYRSGMYYSTQDFAYDTNIPFLPVNTVKTNKNSKSNSRREDNKKTHKKQGITGFLRGLFGRK